MLADALSTACFVLEPSAVQEVVSSLPNVAALMILKNGRMLATPGFPLQSAIAS
jgi:thiamine biosynthesis lipoprotein ApbE